MNLKDINNRLIPPVPWHEGEKIPWNDPQFSKRMLKEHLNQDHDLASRNFKLIDKHVRWICNNFLPMGSARILDLGCGPGFYSERLAQLGHRCTGIDFSPAAIEYARSQNEKHHQDLNYELADLREAEFGSEQDLVLFVFGEFNVFKAPEARQLLVKARQCMSKGGSIVVECSTFDAIRREGLKTATWHSHESGLWSDTPHIVLEEHHWDDVSTTTSRYYIMDAESGSIDRYTTTACAYTDTELISLFAEVGFVEIQVFESLSDDPLDRQESLQVMTARK